MFLDIEHVLRLFWAVSRVHSIFNFSCLFFVWRVTWLIFSMVDLYHWAALQGPFYWSRTRFQWSWFEVISSQFRSFDKQYDLLNFWWLHCLWAVLLRFDSFFSSHGLVSSVLNLIIELDGTFIDWASCLNFCASLLSFMRRIGKNIFSKFRFYWLLLTPQECNFVMPKGHSPWIYRLQYGYIAMLALFGRECLNWNISFLCSV